MRWLDERHLGGYSGQGVRWGQASVVGLTLAARTPMSRRGHADRRAGRRCGLPASGGRDYRDARSAGERSWRKDRRADCDRGARDGHTGSVHAGRRLLAGEGRAGMITLPGDIPAVRASEIDAVLAAHLAAPSFTISPAHDDLGSNAVVCSPPESVPLRFGDNSYFPHLEAARLQGIEPTVIRQPGIAVDIDHPVDLALFLRLPQSAGTRTRTLLEELGVPALLARRGIA